MCKGLKRTPGTLQVLDKWEPMIGLDLVSPTPFQTLVLDRESSLQQMWQPHPENTMPTCEKFPQTLGGRHGGKLGSFLGRRAGCSELWTLVANELSWSPWKGGTQDSQAQKDS